MVLANVSRCRCGHHKSREGKRVVDRTSPKVSTHERTGHHLQSMFLKIFTITYRIRNQPFQILIPWLIRRVRALCFVICALCFTDFVASMMHNHTIQHVPNSTKSVLEQV